MFVQLETCFKRKRFAKGRCEVSIIFLRPSSYTFFIPKRLPGNCMHLKTYYRQIRSLVSRTRVKAVGYSFRSFGGSNSDDDDDNYTVYSIITVKLTERWIIKKNTIYISRIFSLVIVLYLLRLSIIIRVYALCAGVTFFHPYTHCVPRTR